MGRLDGRVAIVTGGGRGLGRAHAMLLAAEGAPAVDAFGDLPVLVNNAGILRDRTLVSARTRLSLSTPGAEESLKPVADGEFDPLDPANVSPLIAWLAQADCPASSQVFHVHGNQIFVMSMPPIVHALQTTGRWTLDALDRELAGRLVTPLDLDDFIGRAR